MAPEGESAFAPLHLGSSIKMKSLIRVRQIAAVLANRASPARVLQTKPADLDADLPAVCAQVHDFKKFVVERRPTAAVPLNQIARCAERLAIAGSSRSIRDVQEFWNAQTGRDW